MRTDIQAGREMNILPSERDIGTMTIISQH